MSGADQPPGPGALRRLLQLAADGGDAALPAVPERYQLVRELGRGGMGVVYEAFDRQLGRRCALKTLAELPAGSAALRRRFAREAQAAARLHHPHIAAVYDATDECIAMQLIDGGPIDALPPDPRAVVAMFRDAARALHHAHGQGIVHRDVKPSNLLVEDGHVFVVDFGLAKELTPGADHSLPGAVVGTPAFMAPEQALGRAADPRTDVYGLGAALHRCLCGAPPFADADLPTLLRRIVEDEPAPRGVDRDLGLVLRHCLQKDPAQRYQSAAELADDLERWLQNEPVRATPPSLAHRARKLLQRHRRAVRAAALAGLAVGLGTAAVLVPIALRQSAARAAAGAAVALADHAAAVLQDAAVFRRLGDHASAQQVLDGAIGRAEAFLQRHEVARARYLLARLLRARGRPEPALLELERAIAAEPDLAEARFERGLLLAALAEPDAAQRRTAIDDLGVAIPAATVLPSVDRLLGKAERLRLLGEHEAAMAVLAEVLEYEPHHVTARLSLSRSALALGRTDEARYHAASAVDLQQGYGPVFLARERQALPVSILGLEAALVDFAPELWDSPDNALALCHRGLVLLRRGLRLQTEGDGPGALTAVQAAIDDHSIALSVHGELAGAWNNRAACHLQAARLHVAAGDGAAAATARATAAGDLARALELAPTLPEALANRGALLLQEAELLRAMGRAEAALTQADAAVAACQEALAAAPAGWTQAQRCRDAIGRAAALRDGAR